MEVNYHQSLISGARLWARHASATYMRKYTVNIDCVTSVFIGHVLPLTIVLFCPSFPLSILFIYQKCLYSFLILYACPNVAPLMIDWVEIIVRHHGIGYGRYPYYAHRVSCLWLLLQRPKTGGNM